jgi:K(+)-stimulated pyrophosphate-energized sodium pump
MYMNDYRPAFAVLIGLVLASVIQVLTQYFTDTKFKPVKEIAEQTQTGPATTILSGFSVGLESTVWAILVIAGAVIGAFLLGDNTAERLYFISLTGMGMLTTVGVVVSMDTYGPISDNAQGIAEMSGEFEGRPAEILGGLDAVGNSTKATKGMAIATAVIAATRCSGRSRKRSSSRASTSSASAWTSPTCSPGCCSAARSHSCSRRSRSARSVGPHPRSWSRCGTSSATTPAS